MSMKENIDYVKQGLSTQEKFLESTVHLERFYKKNKTAIIFFGIVIVVLAIGYPTYSYIQHNKKIQANEAFTTLLEDPSQKDLYKKLSKDNPQLAQIAKYLNGQIQTIQVPYLKELATLQQTLETQQTKQLQNLSMQKDFLLKEYASFHKALIEAKNSEFDKAKQTLEGISDDSEINNLVTLLEHYLLTK